MESIIQRLQRLWWIVRELGHLPEYNAAAERLYRELRANHARPNVSVGREVGLNRRREQARKRLALAGLAVLAITWLLTTVQVTLAAR